MSVVIPQNAEATGGGGGGTDDQTASEVPYNNASSGLSSTNCQTAIDELANLAVINDIEVNTNYLMLPADDLILVNHSAPVQIDLPSVPQEHKAYTIKDKSGDALTNNITIDGNGNLIDGSSTILITSNYGSIDFIYDGSSWNAT